MNSLFKCPVCDDSLQVEDRRYFCEKNHSFDLARAGYVNLLLANQKKSKAPGDTKEMLTSRRDFLDVGYYDELTKSLCRMIQEHVQNPTAILDVGCGEGFFLSQIKANLDNDSVYIGTDISKPAITLAAKRDKEIQFAVAGSFKLPIMPESIDCVLRMFAPGDDSEVVRCLKQGGVLITVTPGPSHLFSLKEIVYKNPQLHAVKNIEIDGLRQVDSLSVYSEISIDNQSELRNLLVMTPYYWNGDRETKDRFDSLTSLKTDIDFVVTVYRK